MPYRSKAQQRKFHAMLSKGEISAATVKEYDQSTHNYGNLPERVGGKSVRAARKTKGQK